MSLQSPLRAPVRTQRGVIMIIALLTLTILLIGAVAAVRSMNVSLSSVGNIGFKRDMTNQVERALGQVRTVMRTGALATAASRQTSSTASNYVAFIQPASPEGIPTAMLNKSGTNFETVTGLGNVANEMAFTGGELHYLIERMCKTEGAVSYETCQTAGELSEGGSSKDEVKPLPQALFRITVRVTGPRNTQSFFQATYTAPAE